MLDQISSPSTSNNWNLDALGNWTSTGTQTRTFNAQNEFTAISGKTTPTYDNNGSMTKDEAGNTYSFDAWNRMISMDAAGTSFPAETYSYDADSRRPGLNICAGAIVNSYYDSSWQDVEDDAYTPPNGCNPASTTVSTYDWSQSYIDDAVARDQSVNGGAATRIYAQQDANHDVTALIATNGAVDQRYVYDPYGTATVLSPTWTGRSDQYSWPYTFQGGRYDPISGKINFRNRDLDTVTGTWMERDPAGYADSLDLYQFVLGDPVSNADPLGKETGACPCADAGGSTSQPAATQPATTRPAYSLPAELADITDDPNSIPQLSTDTWKIGWVDGGPGVTRLGQTRPEGVGVEKTLIAHTLLNRTLLKGKPCMAAAVLAGELKHIENYKKVAASLGLQLGGPITREQYTALGKALQDIAPWSEMDASTEAIRALQSAKQNKTLGKGCKCTESPEEFDKMIAGLQGWFDRNKAAVSGKSRPEVLQ